MGTTPSHFAEVAFPIPLDKAFTYAIPDELHLPVAEGTRVLAPFGVRTLEGVVVGLLETPSIDVERVRPLTDVLDNVPAFPPELLELCHWVSQYYLSSWGEALGAATPAAIRTLSRRRVHLTEGATYEALESLRKRAPVQSAILDSLSVVDGQTVSRLGASLGRSAIHGPLAALESSGLVRIASEVHTAGGPRRVTVASLAQTPAKTAALLPAIKSKAPKQAAVLEYLCRVNESIPLPALRRKTQAGHASMRALVDKGLLVTDRVDEARTPPGQAMARGLEFSTEPLSLNVEQARAFAAIHDALASRRHETFLLRGVTGSGKTEVYMHAIKEVLARGQTALVLVPEIALTPQTAGRFVARFGPQVAVLHSHLSPGERFDEWRRIRTGEARIVVGARSAVFAPLSHLGVIVLDEEHETTYKQEEPDPRYHARDVARERARLAGVPLILGSATPSLETMHAARSGVYTELQLPDRVAQRPMPKVTLCDMREEIAGGNFTIFSRPLREAIADRLERDESVLLFLNRRGSSTYVFCRDCGHVEVCEHCNISLTHHRRQDILICHYCGSVAPAPTSCSACGGSRVRFLGLGTQKVEEVARRTFPDAVVERMDTDTTGRKGAHQRILDSFRDREIDILVGTQMIAKGLDFPAVTLVGIVLGETALHVPDFRAAERAFNLLTQVAGRSGRSELGGEVLLQTYQPDHYSIVAAQQHDYESFVDQELAERRRWGYPPYTHILRLLLRGELRDDTAAVARDLADRLHVLVAENRHEVAIKGPAAAPLSRVRGEYRWHLLLCGNEPLGLGSLARRALEDDANLIARRNVTAIADMDPMSLT